MLEKRARVGRTHGWLYLLDLLLQRVGYVSSWLASEGGTVGEAGGTVGEAGW